MTDGEALAQAVALQDLATSLAALASTEQALHEALHELRFLVEGHPRMCGCRTCAFLARVSKVPGSGIT